MLGGNPTVGAAASLGLAIAGGIMFGPVGTAVGSLIGSFLFSGGGGPAIEGPRMGDLNVAASTHGNVIPIGFATQRMAGTIIWARDIIEKKSTKREGGGLFSKGQKVVTYQYYGSFAVGFAEGPGKVLRIWAGEKLIYDLAEPVPKNRRYRFRVYEGTEEQKPDPLIVREVERELGESHVTPAHRGLIYIAFDRLPLKEWNNQIPPITAEIVFRGEDEQTERVITSIAGGGIFPTTQFNTDTLVWDQQRKRFYHFRNGHAQVGGGAPGIKRFNLLAGVEDLQVHTADVTAGGEDCQPLCVDADGNVYCGDFEVNFSALFKLDGDSLREVVRHTGANAADEQATVVSAYDLSGRNDFLLSRGRVLSEHVLAVTRCSDMAFVYRQDTREVLPGAGAVQHIVAGRAAIGSGEGWAAGTLADQSGIAVFRATMEAYAAFSDGATTGVALDAWTIAASALEAGAATVSTIGGLAYDVDADALIITALTNTGNICMVKWTPDDGVVWTLEVPSTRLPRQCRFTEGQIAVIHPVGVDDDEIYIVDTNAGEIVYQRDGWSSSGLENDFVWDADTRSVIKAARQYFPTRLGRQTVSVGAVVTGLCARVGLDADDLDVSELSDQVRGYAIARQVSVRGALELLAAAYGFDCVESDYRLRFRKRGREPVRVIAEDELAPLEQDGEIFRERRTQDVDLPLRFTVRYTDVDRDSEPGVVTAKRIAAPTPTMYSQNEATLDLPISLTAAEAKAVAVRQCYAPWTERIQHEWMLPWTHLDLDPGDVVTFALKGGRSFTSRILRMGIGRNLSLALETIAEESSSYDVAAVAGAPLGYRRAVASPLSISRLHVVDCPLLADGDDANRLASGVYWFAGGIGQPSWEGCTAFRSLDGVLFAVVDEAVGENEAAWGSAVSVLGATDTPYQTDRSNTLTVQMVTGASRLASVTELEMLNGANQALLIDPDGGAEVIAFANVTAEEGHGRYTLHTLLRGLRGTEGFTGGHRFGSILLLLEDATVQRDGVPLAELGAARHYSPVADDEELADAATLTITPLGRDLMPYRPVHLKSNGASWGNDITLSWVRQTRIGGSQWLDHSAGTPVSEDAEAYELEILDGPGGNVLRTATGITEPGFVYTTAMQNADFGGAQTELTFRVYQLSAQVGRGFASEDTTVDTQ